MLFIEIIHQISLSGFSKLLNRTNELEKLSCLILIKIIHQISLSGFYKLLNRTNEFENTVDLDQLSSVEASDQDPQCFPCQYGSNAIN